MTNEKKYHCEVCQIEVGKKDFVETEDLIDEAVGIHLACGGSVHEGEILKKEFTPLPEGVHALDLNDMEGAADAMRALFGDVGGHMLTKEEKLAEARAEFKEFAIEKLEQLLKLAKEDKLCAMQFVAYENGENEGTHTGYAFGACKNDQIESMLAHSQIVVNKLFRAMENEL